MSKSCTQASCNCWDQPFKKPKSYSEILKENQALSAENISIQSKYVEKSRTIKSLQDLNMSLIQKLKEKEEQMLQAEQNVLKAEEQKQLFIRTYTNMSIELLKLEEKLAKLEGRHF